MVTDRPLVERLCREFPAVPRAVIEGRVSLWRRLLRGEMRSAGAIDVAVEQQVRLALRAHGEEPPVPTGGPGRRRSDS